MTYCLMTERLIIQELSEDYFRDYHHHFTEEITRFQYPDPFQDYDAAKRFLSDCLTNMRKGKMLELMIQTKAGHYLGSMEVFDLDSATPELGLWLKQDCQGKGYGYEALKAVVADLFHKGKYNYFIYEVDVRNAKSVRLVEAFHSKKATYQEFRTDSGKLLYLQTYHIYE